MLVRAAVLAFVGAALSAAPAAAQPRVKVGGDVSALAFSADGQWLAVGDGQGAVTVYSMKSRREKHEMPKLVGPVRFVGWTGPADLAAADDRALVVWNFAFVKEGFRLDLANRGGAGDVRVLANPQRALVAIVAPAGGEGTVEVIDVGASGRPVVTSISKVSARHQAAWSADGAWMLLDGAAWGWSDLRSWRPPHPGLAAIGAGGKMLAYVDPARCADGISLVDLGSRKVMRTILPGESGCPAALWVIDGGRALLWMGSAGGKPTGLWRWDAERDRVRAVRRSVPHHPAVALSPDERLLAVPDGGSVRFVSTR